jgi:hypothetical protein
MMMLDNIVAAFKFMGRDGVIVDGRYTIKGKSIVFQVIVTILLHGFGVLVSNKFTVHL